MSFWWIYVFVDIVTFMIVRCISFTFFTYRLRRAKIQTTILNLCRFGLIIYLKILRTCVGLQLLLELFVYWWQCWLNEVVPSIFLPDVIICSHVLFPWILFLMLAISSCWLSLISCVVWEGKFLQSSAILWNPLAQVELLSTSLVLILVVSYRLQWIKYYATRSIDWDFIPYCSSGDVVLN